MADGRAAGLGGPRRRLGRRRSGPVLVGVMLPATGPAMEAARQAADEGADALVVGSPYYLGVDAAAQQRHVEAILGAVSLPVLLYNIPQATHNPLAPATVTRLAQDPRILGIKDSAGDFEAFQGFLAIKKRRAAFRGVAGERALRVGQPPPGRRRPGPRHGEFRARPLRGPAPRCGDGRRRGLCAITGSHHRPVRPAHPWPLAARPQGGLRHAGPRQRRPVPAAASGYREHRRAIRAILARHDMLPPQPEKATPR